MTAGDSSAGTGGGAAGGMGGATGKGGAGGIAGAGGSGVGGSGMGGRGGSGSGGSGTGGSGTGGSGTGGSGTGGSGTGGRGTGGSATGGSGVGGSGTGGTSGVGGSGAGGAGSVCNNGSSDTCGHVLAALGTCAAGTTTCSAGKWGPCSIQPKSADTCDIGNDDTCDGVPNTGCLCDGFSPPADHPNPADYDTSVVGIVIDKATGRMWERNPPSATYNQGDAAAYCVANRLGGFLNWRLPTVTELASLLDFSVASPLINSSVFPNTVASRFWTSTPADGNGASVWAINFSSSEVQPLSTTFGYQVRCVRSFSRSVDYTRPSSTTAAMINPVAFPNTPPQEFWTSSAPGGGFPMIVTFGDGETIPYAPISAVQVRCVH
jgi:hypothetical protein